MLSYSYCRTGRTDSYPWSLFSTMTRLTVEDSWRLSSWHQRPSPGHSLRCQDGSVSSAGSGGWSQWHEAGISCSVGSRICFSPKSYSKLWNTQVKSSPHLYLHLDWNMIDWGKVFLQKDDLESMKLVSLKNLSLEQEATATRCWYETQQSSRSRSITDGWRRQWSWSPVMLPLFSRTLLSASFRWGGRGWMSGVGGHPDNENNNKKGYLWSQTIDNRNRE